MKFISILLAYFILLPATVYAANKPLLIPGKQALYQRILAMPEGQMHPAIEQQPSRLVTPFTAYYVYAREEFNAVEWLQVGTDRHGDIAGWLRATDALEWHQGLTAAFREPVDHDQVLLFDRADSLQRVAQQRDLQYYTQLYQAAVEGKSLKHSPVVAIQPPGKLDIRENFYLVPIQQHQDIYLGSERARMLQVASVPLKQGQSAVTQLKPKGIFEEVVIHQPFIEDSAMGGQTETSMEGYRAGLVFAIDATLSMQPYIDRTRQAVREIYSSLDKHDLLGQVNFGLVSFRDATQAVPGLEYLTRTYVDLEQGSNPKTFLNQVNTLQAAEISSQDFVEDTYAGVRQAIEGMDWRGHAARYVVLITDAGPRDSDDRLSSTGLNAAELRKLAQEKNVAIFVMHLLTPSTKANFTLDAKKYKQLSDFPGIGSLYYGVPTGDVDEFGLVLDTLAQQITRQVGAALGKDPVVLTKQPIQQQSLTTEQTEQLAALTSKVKKLGYALRMRYLQKTADGKLPRLFNAWLLDRDIRNPEKRTLDIRVLLTRDQLSDLYNILRQVLQTAEDGLLSPQNFLNELKSLAATITRDPEQLGRTTAITAGQGNSLADLGFMREYIEDLPYAAEVMNLSLDDWENWPARRQITFLMRLEEKIDYYRALHDHTDLWVSLDGGPIDGDAVFPIALEMLP